MKKQKARSKFLALFLVLLIPSSCALNAQYPLSIQLKTSYLNPEKFKTVGYVRGEACFEMVDLCVFLRFLGLPMVTCPISSGKGGYQEALEKALGRYKGKVFLVDVSEKRTNQSQIFKNPPWVPEQ